MVFHSHSADSSDGRLITLFCNTRQVSESVASVDGPLQNIGLFSIGSTSASSLDRKHSRYPKFLQVHQGQFVLAAVSLRFWPHTNSFFAWSIIPLYINRINHWALEQALIQLWQPPLNFLFTCQIFHLVKGCTHECHTLTNDNLAFVACGEKPDTVTLPMSFAFQHRVKPWTLLHDFGSNARRRFENIKFIRSLAFPLESLSS